MNYEKLVKSKKYYFHHSAYFRGYVSRVGDYGVEKYNGRFGKGYKVYVPNWNSTTYSFVRYYIEKAAG